MNGLAQTQQPQQQPQGLPTVEEIVALLQQGISPEELVQSGIPAELIQQAIQILQSDMAAPQPMGPGQEGLAGAQIPVVQ